MKNSSIKLKETEIGPIPEEWEVLSVADVAKVNEKVISTKDQLESIDYLDTASVNNGIISNFQNLELDLAPSRAKRILRDGDTVISTVRPNLKHFAFIKNAQRNWIGSTGFAVVTPQKVDPRFLYFSLTTDAVTEYLSSIAASQTSTYPAINPDVIEGLLIAIPPENEQKQIAEILCSIDDKIELNRAINTNLEKLASSLFKHWFIDFEFLNEDGKPYKSSGGKMVDSELGEIPEGWDIVPLRALAKLTMGLSPKGESYNEIGQGTPLLNGAADFQGKKITPKKYTSQPTRLCNEGDLILCIRATIGNLTLADKKYCLGRGVASLTPNKKAFREYIYFVIHRSLQGLIAKASGSVISGLSKPDIEGLRILLPNENILNSFHDLTREFLNYEVKNDEDIISLGQVRDSLLPRLMNGKIRVNT